MKNFKYIKVYPNRLGKLKKSLMPLILMDILLLFLLQEVIFLVGSTTINNKVGIKVSVPQYWPTNGWQTSQPEDQGMNFTKLQELHKYIREQNFPLDSVIVVRNGFIVYEDYPNPNKYGEYSLHVQHSVTKSFTSALIGIAIQEGYIGSVDDSVISYFPNRTIANLDAWKQNMTIEHLLNMMAGMEWDETTYPYGDPRNNLRQMVDSDNCVQFMLDRNMTTAPGTVWIYNTGASHLLGAIIRQTTGKTPRGYGIDVLFKSLGITILDWHTDSQGLNYGGSELYLRPRDMAKFGFLYLQNGKWDGQQIVPEIWVNKSRESKVIPWSGCGYGYQWWKDLNMDTFYAHGLYQQNIIVNPENNLVIVFTASDYNYQIPISYLVSEYIISAIGEFTNINNSFPWEITLTLSLLIGIPISVIIIFLVRKRIK